MKNSLYAITGLLIITWIIVFYGFKQTEPAHILLLISAGISVLVRILINKPSLIKR